MLPKYENKSNSVFSSEIYPHRCIFATSTYKSRIDVSSYIHAININGGLTMRYDSNKDRHCPAFMTLTFSWGYGQRKRSTNKIIANFDMYNKEIAKQDKVYTRYSNKDLSKKRLFQLRYEEAERMRSDSGRKNSRL